MLIRQVRYNGHMEDDILSLEALHVSMLCLAD